MLPRDSQGVKGVYSVTIVNHGFKGQETRKRLAFIPKGEAMLQGVNIPNYAEWPGATLNQVVLGPRIWEQKIRTRRDPGARPSPNTDITQLYPEAVVASSDAFAWQNIRLIHLRQAAKELGVPASDNHCLLLNLGAPLSLKARLSKRDFEGQVPAGDVAIIP